MQRLEVGHAIDTEHHGFAVDNKLLCRFLGALSTIHG
jgi:hypothetical protein